MRLSSLVVAVVLSVSPVIFAQHSSGGGSGSSGSSSSSHSSSSSGSSSSNHSSSAHSSGSSASSSNRSSGPSGSRSSSTGSAVSHSKTQASSFGTAGAIREPNKTNKEGTTEPAKKPQPEHKGVFAFLHHRHRKPEPKDAAQPVETKRRHRACPPGESAGKNGVCVANPTNVSTQCAPNSYDGSCPDNVDPQNLYAGSWPNNANRCASFLGQLDPVAAELRSIKAEMQTSGCPGTSPGQACGFLSQRREAAVARYRAIQSGVPINCGTLPDPLSL